MTPNENNCIVKYNNNNNNNIFAIVQSTVSGFYIDWFCVYYLDSLKNVELRLLSHIDKLSV